MYLLEYKMLIFHPQSTTLCHICYMDGLHKPTDTDSQIVKRGELELKTTKEIFSPAFPPHNLLQPRKQEQQSDPQGGIRNGVIERWVKSPLILPQLPE